MGLINLRITDIEIGERHRALSADAVSRLAASMGEIGLRQPITVRIVEEMMVDGHLTAGVPVLVAGRHRLAAAKALGWQSIDCVVIDGDEIAAELWELAENLHRLDLTKEQRDEHIRRYAELLEARKAAQIQVPQDAAPEIGYRKPPPQEKGIPRQIAEETGLSVDTVRRALNPKPAPEPKSALPDHDVVTVQFNALVGAWNRAGAEAREMFRDHIDAPVFDQTRAA